MSAKAPKGKNPGVVDQNVQSSEGGINFFEQPRDIWGLGDGFALARHECRKKVGGS